MCKITSGIYLRVCEKMRSELRVKNTAIVHELKSLFIATKKAYFWLKNSNF